MIVINLKNYHAGKEVLRFCKQLQSNLKKVIVCPPLLQLQEVKQNTTLSVFSQVVSSFNKTNTTGHVTLDSLQNIGVAGSIINHSEHRISFNDISVIVREAKKIGVKIIVCVANLREAKKVLALKPWAIAFEDPKLIGSGKSITEYRSKEVKEFALLFRCSSVIPLCGAGISSPEDYKAALDLGCKGVLVASALAKSKKPDMFLKSI